METTEMIKTKDYGMFSYIRGNRPVNERKVRQLLESFKQRPNKIFVYVNNKFQIVDGQHRLEVARRLNQSVNCINLGNVGLGSVQAWNSTNNAWKKSTFLDSYASQNVEAYVRFKEFVDNNKDFGLIGCLNIFLNKANSDKGKDIRCKGIRFSLRNFEDGQLEMPNINSLQIAYENAGKIRQYGQYYRGYNRRSFVNVMIGLLQNKEFKHEVMLHKLSLQPSALVDCTTADQYRSLLESIYNYKSSKKINLRF